MTRRLADFTRHIARSGAHGTELREHEKAMRDLRVAVEHQAAIDRSQARGGPGCPFCH